VVSKEVESTCTIEYVCKVGACMETYDQVGVRKQLKRQRFSNKKITSIDMNMIRNTNFDLKLYNTRRSILMRLKSLLPQKQG